MNRSLTECKYYYHCLNASNQFLQSSSVSALILLDMVRLHTVFLQATLENLQKTWERKTKSVNMVRQHTVFLQATLKNLQKTDRGKNKSVNIGHLNILKKFKVCVWKFLCNVLFILTWRPSFALWTNEWFIDWV